jgi:hypothetical protein
MTTEELLQFIHAALDAGDMPAVVAGVRILAVQSPRDAEAILDVLSLVKP